MGYRSQVRALIYGEPDKLGAFITAHSLLLGSPVFQHFAESLTRYESEAWYDINEKSQKKTVHVLDLYGDDWKWYEDYSDVQAWEKFMQDAPNWHLDYEFVRIGEDRDDVIEERTNDSHNFLYVGSPPIIEDIHVGVKFDIYGKILDEDT